MYIESIGRTDISWFGFLFFAAVLYPLPLSAVISITKLPPSATVAICKSGFSTSTVPSVIISPAVTSPSPLKFIFNILSSLSCDFNLTLFKLTIISGTSSTTFGIVENSCTTPSIFTPVIAHPGSDESKILLKEFPNVTPYPLSNGSHTNFA